METTYHYPPELFDLMVDCIPRLTRSKRDVIEFFRGAGVNRAIVAELETRLRVNAIGTTKFDMTRYVLAELNKRDNNDFLRQRREILKRVTEFDSFDHCWPSDTLIAKGLVAEIRDVVNKKDTFTRLKVEREREHTLRKQENQERLEKMRRKNEKLDDVYRELSNLLHMDNPQKRGKALERVLNNLFQISGLLVREAFTVKDDVAQGVTEQIDGVIELDSHLYIVEMKWLKEPMGSLDMDHQLMRLFLRSDVGGIVISASKFTSAAVAHAKEALTHKTIILIHLGEIFRWLETKADMAEIIRKKIEIARLDKNPWEEIYG